MFFVFRDNLFKSEYFAPFSIFCEIAETILEDLGFSNPKPLRPSVLYNWQAMIHNHTLVNIGLFA